MSLRVSLLFFCMLAFSGYAPALYAGEEITEHEYRVLEKVQMKLAKDDSQAALSLVLPLLSEKKPSSYALSYAAIAYANLGKTSKSLEIWQRAVTLFPKVRNLWYNLAILQMQVEEYSGATQSFSSVIDLDKQQGKLDVDIYYHLAFAYYQLGKFAQAEQTIKTVTVLEKPKKHWLLLQINCQIAQQKWSEAEKSGRQLVSFDPNDGYVWQLLGQIAVNQEEYKKAIVYTEVSQATDFRKGNAQILDQLYGAEQAFAEQARVERLSDDIDLTYVDHLVRSWQFKEALSALSVVEKQHGANMETSLLQGKIYCALGRTDEALATLAGLEKFDYLFLQQKAQVGEEKLAQKRHAKDKIKGKALFLIGQIYWLDHKWVQARDVYKRLELLPGYQETGKALALCMQNLISEKETVVEMPSLLDPPIVIGKAL